MAGFTKRLAYSLRWRLAVGLSLLVSAVALVAGAVSYRTAFKEAHALQDAQLKHIAMLIGPGSPILRNDTPPQSINFPETADDLPPPDIVIQDIASPRVEYIFGSTNARAQLQQYGPGFHDFSAAGHHWRVYIRTIRRPERQIVIAQRAAYRNRIAQDSARLAVWPLLVLIPLVWLFSGVLVHRLFRPINRLSADLNRRTESDLQPLDSRHVPQEVLPLVKAINHQFGQIEAAREHDKRFIGNAAHELRTPITALTLQAAALAQEDLSTEARREKLAKVRGGLQRTQQLLNQLLNMARAQNTPKKAEAAEVALLPLLRTLYAGLLPLTEQKQLDMGVLLEQDYQLLIEPADLHSILKNLLENAVRYTPEGGRIDVWCEEKAGGVLAVCVADSGIGVPLAQRVRIFEPFYRIGHGESGSGLGLAIVQTLCSKWHLALELADSPIGSDQHPGLMAALQVPSDMWRKQT